MKNETKVGSFSDLNGKVFVVDPRDGAEKAAEKIVSAAMPAEMRNPTLSEALGLDVETLVAENEADVELLVAEIDMLSDAPEKLRRYESLLAETVSANKKKGITIDTDATTRLKNAISTLKGADKLVSKDAVSLAGFRKTHGEVEAMARRSAELLRHAKAGEEVKESEVDSLIDDYRDHFHELYNRHLIAEVPYKQLELWRNSRKSFSDFAFSAKDKKGNRVWCWGKLGDEQSMTIAKSMKGLYIAMDRLVRFLDNQKTNAQHIAQSLSKAQPTAPSSKPVSPETPPYEIPPFDSSSLPS